MLLLNQEEEMKLVVYDQETGKKYVSTLIESADELVVQWEHSVERETWQEKLQINEAGDIVLVETRFRSFGAGVPNMKEEGNVYFADGYLVMSDLYEVKEYYQWIHSHNAKFMIFINNEQLVDTTDIPHHHKAEIIIEKG